MATETSTDTGGELLSDNQTVVALLFGAVLTLVGILGFAGVLVQTQGGESFLLGLFGITPVHNAIHLLTGLIGLVAGFYAGGAFGEEYNKYLGLVYIVVFVVGVIAVAAGVSALVDLLNLNMADNVLHLVLGVVLAGVGYGLGGS